jgi:hypothetical protein
MRTYQYFNFTYTVKKTELKKYGYENGSRVSLV